MEKAGTLDFIDLFEDFIPKIGIHSYPNEHMKSYEYKRSSHSLSFNKYL